MKILFALCVSVLVLSCNQYCEKSDNQSVVSGQMEHKALATLFMQKSAEYRALTFQTYNFAKIRLDQLLEQNDYQKPVIIIDVDETILNNSPYSGMEILEDTSFTFDNWKQWTDMGDADTISGSVSFLKYADSKGISLYYVTNRAASESEGTISNFIKFDIPQSSPDHFLFKTTTSGKKGRRDSIIALGFEPLLFIGDNLNDLSEIYENKSSEDRNQLIMENSNDFGSKFILFPNPNYGAWEKAIYNNSYNWTAAQKDSLRRDKIHSFR